jgi:hypothetical protein
MQRSTRFAHQIEGAARAAANRKARGEVDVYGGVGERHASRGIGHLIEPAFRLADPVEHDRQREFIAVEAREQVCSLPRKALSDMAKQRIARIVAEAGSDIAEAYDVEFGYDYGPVRGEQELLEPAQKTFLA